ncbi:hypothetical protein Bbelb_408670 [Branchiostoma belcheri]|nr:hypothetical protein Bbelb_408670 [Branchiostoma belcheri]
MPPESAVGIRMPKYRVISSPQMAVNPGAAKRFKMAPQREAAVPWPCGIRTTLSSETLVFVKTDSETEQPLRNDHPYITAHTLRLSVVGRLSGEPSIFILMCGTGKRFHEADYSRLDGENDVYFRHPFAIYKTAIRHMCGCDCVEEHQTWSTDLSDMTETSPVEPL